jgi:hypothetical protein
MRALGKVSEYTTEIRSDLDSQAIGKEKKK